MTEGSGGPRFSQPQVKRTDSALSTYHHRGSLVLGLTDRVHALDEGPTSVHLHVPPMSNPKQTPGPLDLTALPGDAEHGEFTLTVARARPA